MRDAAASHRSAAPGLRRPLAAPPPPVRARLVARRLAARLWLLSAVLATQSASFPETSCNAQSPPVRSLHSAPPAHWPAHVGRRYSFYWDVVKDWGLGDMRHGGLREELLVLPSLLGRQI